MAIKFVSVEAWCSVGENGLDEGFINADFCGSTRV